MLSVWFTKRSRCCSLTFQDTRILELTCLTQNMVFWPPLKRVYCVLGIHENWGGVSMYINTLQGCSFSLLMRHFKMHIYIVKVSIHLPEKKSCMEAWSCQLLGSDCKSRKAEVFFISSCLCSLPCYFLSYTEASGTRGRARHSAVSGSPVSTMMLSWCHILRRNAVCSLQVLLRLKGRARPKEQM